MPFSGNVRAMDGKHQPPITRVKRWEGYSRRFVQRRRERKQMAFKMRTDEGTVLVIDTGLTHNPGEGTAPVTAPAPADPVALPQEPTAPAAAIPTEPQQ